MRHLMCIKTQQVMKLIINRDIYSKLSFLSLDFLTENEKTLIVININLLFRTSGKYFFSKGVRGRPGSPKWEWEI